MRAGFARFGAWRCSQIYAHATVRITLLTCVLRLMGSTIPSGPSACGSCDRHVKLARFCGRVELWIVRCDYVERLYYPNITCGALNVHRMTAQCISASVFFCWRCNLCMPYEREIPNTKTQHTLYTIRIRLLMISDSRLHKLIESLRIDQHASR